MIDKQTTKKGNKTSVTYSLKVTTQQLKELTEDIKSVYSNQVVTIKVQQ